MSSQLSHDAFRYARQAVQHLTEFLSTGSGHSVDMAAAAVGATQSGEPTFFGTAIRELTRDR